MSRSFPHIKRIFPSTTAFTPSISQAPPSQTRPAQQSGYGVAHTDRDRAKSNRRRRIIIWGTDAPRVLFDAPPRQTLFDTITSMSMSREQEEANPHFRRSHRHHRFNLERSLAFWRDVLGFELSHTAHQKGELAQEITGVEGAEYKLAVLKAPGGHKVELLLYFAPPDRKCVDLRPCDLGSVHVALLVEDLDAVRDGLLPQAGTPPVNRKPSKRAECR